MRKSTKTAVGAISLGILGLSYQLGTSATPSSGTFASPTENVLPVVEPSASTTTDPVSAQSGSQPTTSQSPAASTETLIATNPTTTATGVTKTGDSIESGFGPVQVKVTKVSGKITEITYLQSVATHGRAAAFPYLVQYAIDANGSNFANLSGATFTANAFKQSLDSALAKF